MRPPGRRLHRPRSKGLQPRARARCGLAPTPTPQGGRPRTTGTLSGSPCPRPSSPGRSGRAEHRQMSSRSGRGSTCASKPWLLVRWSAVLQFNVVLEVLAADRGQRRWDLAGGEPADLGAFLRLADGRLARRNATDERGRHPMLALVREHVVHDVEQLAHLDLDAVFLAYLAPERIGEPFTQLHRAPGELPQPALILRLRAATGEEQPALLVHNDRAHADADIVHATFHLAAQLHPLRLRM